MFESENRNLTTLLTGLSFGESPRWHEGRLWVCDWGAEELLAVDSDGHAERVMGVASFPFCIAWLPDGRLLVNSARDAKVLRREADGSVVTHAELSVVSDPPPGNEIVTDGRGNAYVNGGGFNLMAGEEFKPGLVALVTPDGAAREVAGGIAFPNGMAITPDNSTLIVAESYAKKLTAFDIEADGSLSGRRTWADLGDGVPDGICLDAEGAVWYADVPNKRCSRVRAGGEVLERIDLDLGCFSCTLGGADGRTLYMVVREWHGLAEGPDGERTGKVLTAAAPAPSGDGPGCSSKSGGY
jgi:sugar lactone lactonase YvrE